ncbi:MAG: glutamine synthetase [Bacteriovoracaceae bacterium]|nr:glutamine synthetase [Bacteriovoracaceae bacterium]
MNQEILNEIHDSGVTKVKVAITDIDGVMRGKIINTQKFLASANGGFGFCNVVFGWDANDLCYENAGIEYTGWHTGYPDAQAEIDLTTFRHIPWEENTPFFLADFKDSSGKTLEICPRGLLKKVRKDCMDQGFKAVFAQEFEWFNFREDSVELNDAEFVAPNPITRGMFGYSVLRASQNGEFFNDLFDLMGEFDVEIEGLHTETGPGVYEAAIMYNEVLEAADRAVLFKASAKEIGDRHGIIPTFMAKWNDKLPGCSGHIHQSLWRDGKNVFFDKADPNKMSEVMKSYMAGLLLGLPQVLPMYAPTVNSYKRLVEGMWAPTTLTWGIDNRTTALRALPGSEKATRIENRVVGSDVNPYLAMAASLACGMYGVKNKLKLETPAITGNGYEEKSYGVLPRNLWDATKAMEKSEMANELFGETFVKHFCATRIWECKQFDKSVTDWELKRYFEVI